MDHKVNVQKIASAMSDSAQQFVLKKHTLSLCLTVEMQKLITMEGVCSHVWCTAQFMSDMKLK